MLGVTTPIMAQDNAKAEIEAITKTIKANPAAAADQVKDCFKKNKKNSEVLVGIGRAYLDIKDTLNAQKYADLAIKANKKYAPGYILQGDIEVVKDDGGAAAGWYQQAIYFDPKNPDGYIKYANIYRGRSPEEAVAKLQDLHAQIPDYPVDAAAAHIYYQSNKFDKAVASYDKVDKEKLDENRLTEYSLAAWLNQNPNKSLEVALYGIQKYPKDAALNRLAFYNYTDTKDYNNSLKYADALFNKSDSAKFSFMDYLYYGYAYMGVKQYDNAISMFKKSLEENNERIDALKQISEAYAAKNDYIDAIDYYTKYLDGVKDKQATDVAGLGTLYENAAEKQTGSERVETLKKADAVYAELAEKFSNAAIYGNLQRARVNAHIEKDVKEGLAKPYYEKVAELIEAKSTKDENDNKRLVEAYSYIGYNLLLKNDSSNKGYWQKVYEIDPTNSNAKQVLGIK